MEMDHHMPILVVLCFCKRLDPFYQKPCWMMQLLNVKECVQIYWMWMHCCQHEHKIFEDSHYLNCFETSSLYGYSFQHHSYAVQLWYFINAIHHSFVPRLNQPTSELIPPCIRDLWTGQAYATCPNLLHL
jgi:hypothetical protein